MVEVGNWRRKSRGFALEMGNEFEIHFDCISEGVVCFAVGRYRILE